MFIALTDEQRALQDELRAYFENVVTPQEREEMLTERHGTVYRDVVRRLGRDGWLGVGWPVEYGGRGFGDLEQQIFVNEAARAYVPLPYVTLQTVGPTLMRYGTDEQKRRFLPGILSGDLHFAIGYTEPEAGTDLASLRTTAERQKDHYLVNGQKIFTTGAHDADYIWLAARTDPAAAKHKGISILIVDTADPGFSWTPIITCDGAHHVNATYYQDIRVPVGMLVGREDDGWKLITTQLNHERVMLGPAGWLSGLYERVRGWAATAATPDGAPVLAQRDVRRMLGEVHAAHRINELLNWKVASSGAVAVADASATKIFASERIQYFNRRIEDLIGRYGNPADRPTDELARWLDLHAKRNLVLTFGGGVNEVQRELIATLGLGLPRVPR